MTANENVKIRFRLLIAACTVEI